MKQLNSVSRLTPEVFSYQSLSKLEKSIYSQTYVQHCVFSEFCFGTFKAFGSFLPQFYFDYNVLEKKKQNKTEQNNTIQYIEKRKDRHNYARQNDINLGY